MRDGQFGTNYQFAPHECITRMCENCGKDVLKRKLEEANKDIMKSNKSMQWHVWRTVEGKSAPQKCQVKGTIRQGVNQFLSVVTDISPHLFRAN